MIQSAADRGMAFLDRMVERSRSARIPAYGRQMLEARKRGLQPRQQMVMVVFDWNLARAFPRLVVDPISDFDRLDFSYAAGLDVVIGFRAHEAFIAESLARVILKANPRRLQGWPLEPDDEGRFKTRFFKTADGSNHDPI